MSPTVKPKPKTKLERDLLAQRAKLIKTEAAVAAEVRIAVKKLVKAWVAKVKTVLASGGTAAQVADASRLARILRDMGQMTDATVDAVEAVAKKAYAQTFKQESAKFAHKLEQHGVKVNAGVGYTFAGVAKKQLATAATNPLPGIGVFKSFASLSTIAKRRMQQDVVTAIAEGKGWRPLAKKWAAGAGAGRLKTDAEAFARTSLMAASNQAMVAQALASGAKALRWDAAFDLRTCFVAGVSVTTSEGDKPIESVRPGELVLTGRGRWRRVLDTTRRRWEGPTTTVKIGDRFLPSTWDHPIWLAGYGWVAAVDLAVGDVVAVLSQERREFRPRTAGDDVIFGQPEYGVPASGHPCVAPAVTVSDPRLGMPVPSVGFDDQCLPDEGVDVPPSYLELRNELDAPGAELLAESYFDRRRELARSVTGVGTISTGLGRNVAELDAALKARRRTDGSITKFRTIASSMGVPFTAGPELFTAPPTPRDNTGTFATTGAPRVTARHRNLNDERASAPAAYFVDRPSFEDVPAGNRTRFSATANPVAVSPDGCAANGTRFEPGFLFGRHESIVPGKIDGIGLSWISEDVYCLVVDEDESFFAEGILVHNCPTCAGNNGKVFPLASLPAMPAHPNCRCAWQPIFDDANLQGAIEQPGNYPAPAPIAVAPTRDFEDWLKSRPTGEQLDFFGSQVKQQAWANGSIRLDAMTSPLTGRVLTDKELLAKLGQAQGKIAVQGTASARSLPPLPTTPPVVAPPPPPPPIPPPPPVLYPGQTATAAEAGQALDDLVSPVGKSFAKNPLWKGDKRVLIDEDIAAADAVPAEFTVAATSKGPVNVASVSGYAQDVDKASIRKLIEQLAADGLPADIAEKVVLAVTDDVTYAVAGESYAAAARLLGYEQIPATVINRTVAVEKFVAATEKAQLEQAAAEAAAEKLAAEAAAAAKKQAVADAIKAAEGNLEALYENQGAQTIAGVYQNQLYDHSLVAARSEAVNIWKGGLNSEIATSTFESIQDVHVGLVTSATADLSMADVKHWIKTTAAEGVKGNVTLLKHKSEYFLAYESEASEVAAADFLGIKTVKARVVDLDVIEAQLAKQAVAPTKIVATVGSEPALPVAAKDLLALAKQVVAGELSASGLAAKGLSEAELKKVKGKVSDMKYAAKKKAAKAGSIIEPVPAPKFPAVDLPVTASYTPKPYADAAVNGLENVPVVVDASSMTKYAEQKGSNPGGFYRDQAGTEWYIKTPADYERARNEVLAAKLYREAGVAVPDVEMVNFNGKAGVASKVIPDLEKLAPSEYAKAYDGFAVDAWLANWDVVGMDYDNLVKDVSGRVVRIDAGGSLRFRAKGALKGAAFGDTVGELESFLSGPNPQSAKVFAGISEEQIIASINKVAAVTPAAIEKLVEAYGPVASDERRNLIDRLLKRRKFLVEHRDKLIAERGKPKPKYYTKWSDIPHKEQEGLRWWVRSADNSALFQYYENPVKWRVEQMLKESYGSEDVIKRDVLHNRRVIEGLEALLKKAPPVETPMNLYRGIGVSQDFVDRYLGKWIEQGEWVSEFTQSASKSLSKAGDFGGGQVHVRLHFANTSQALDIDAIADRSQGGPIYEQELFIRRGARFRVKRATGVGTNRIDLYLEDMG